MSSTLPRRLILAGLLALPVAGEAASTAPGGPYKCAGKANVPVYQDEPCPAGRELRNFADDPPNVSVVPFGGAPSAPATKTPRPDKPAKAAVKAEKTKRVVDAAERKHAREGMSEGEVLARLGPPDMQAGKGARQMRWTYLPAAGDPQTMTLLRFEDGKVTSVERRVLR